MKKKMFAIFIVCMFAMVSIPTVLGNEAEINNNEWKIITMKGKCYGWSSGTILHFFSIWATPQPMRYFQLTEDTKIKINGELYPIEGNSSVLIEGFVGKAISPFEWMVKEKQGLKRPYDFTVFGFCKHIEVTTE